MTAISTPSWSLLSTNRYYQKLSSKDWPKIGYTKLLFISIMFSSSEEYSSVIENTSIANCIVRSMKSLPNFGDPQ